MIPSTSFYLLRHGESEANVAQVAAGGGVDSPLTERGRAQARELADVIIHLHEQPSVIFASPMHRARETAQIVNTALNLPLHIVDDLDEHRFGDWEGVDWHIIKDKVYAGEEPPNGETYGQYAQRVLRVLTPVLSRKFAAPPLIVAHGGTFYSIMKLYQMKKAESVKNCHLHRFDPYPANAEAPWKIWEFNPYQSGLQRNDAAFCPQVQPIT